MNDRTAVALVKTEIPSLSMAESELISVMQNSIYPGARLDSIKLVLGYCRAAGLDPMTKPVHIVPMSVKVKGENGKKDSYVERDVVMPGVDLYRTKASTTGAYVGKTEPEFGPTQKMKFKERVWEDDGQGGRQSRTTEAEIEYPEWCRVTVRKLVDGRVCEWTAKEYWLENYATAGRDSTAPNAMWKKRPRGQLAKCAEAQALRMAFAGVIGSQPTAEEMEGKTLDEGAIIDGATGEVTQRVTLPREKAPEREAQRDEAPAAEVPKVHEGDVLPPKGAKANGAPASKSQIDLIRRKAAQAEIGMHEIAKRFNLPYPGEKDGDPLAGISTATGNAILDFLRNPAGA